MLEELLSQAAAMQGQEEGEKAPAEGGAAPEPEAAVSEPVAGSSAAADDLNEALANSLDALLKQAAELQAVASEAGTPPASEPVAEPVAEANVPVEPTREEANEPEARVEADAAPAAEPASEKTSEERATHADSIQSLDAELAALTDDLLAGEVEAPAPAEAAPAAVAAAASETASASGTQDGPLASAAEVRTDRASVRDVVASPLLSRPLRAAEGVAVAALGAIAGPLRGNRTLQHSVGWLAAYTLFLASGLWIYLMVFHSPPVPQAHGVAPGLRGGEAHGATHDGHGDGEHGAHGVGDGSHDDHGSHGAEKKPGAKDTHGASADHGNVAKAGHKSGHGGASAGKADHGAKGGHEATPLKVINGYAISRTASTKSEKSGGGHGDAKSGGHGAKDKGAAKGGGHH